MALVVLVVALGVFLRFFRLDWQSLWVDEVHTLGPALHASSLSDGFWNYINLSPTPPLYYLFIWGWSKVFGFSDFILRLPSAAIGVLVMAVFYYGLLRTFSRDISAIGLVLMTLSWPAFFYSQELRGYEAVLGFVTWSAVLWMAILRNFRNSSAAEWGQLTGAALLAAMTHPFGFILVGFEFLYLFLVALQLRVHRVRVVVLGSLPVVAYAAWLGANLFGIDWVLGQQNMWSPPDLRFMVDVGAFLFHHPVPALLTAVIPLTLGATSYGRRLRLAVRAWDLTEPSIYLPFMLAAPFAFIFAVAQVQPFLYSRYLIVFLPFIYAFCAVVLTSRPWRDHATPVILISVLALASLYWILRDYYVVDKEQVRELAHFVRAEAGARDAIATGCDTKVFVCALGPNLPTDADWSKYLYYLNYDTLPVLAVVPDVFHSPAELDAMIERYRAEGMKRLIVMGSRKGVSYVEEALNHLRERGTKCELRPFYLAAAALCPLS